MYELSLWRLESGRSNPPTKPILPHINLEAKGHDRCTQFRYIEQDCEHLLLTPKAHKLAEGQRTNIGPISILMHQYSHVLGIPLPTLLATSGWVCPDLSSKLPHSPFRLVTVPENVIKIDVFRKECCRGQETGCLIHIDKRTLELSQTTGKLGRGLSCTAVILRRLFQAKVQEIRLYTPKCPFPQPER
jgi:hypothetical protein